MRQGYPYPDNPGATHYDGCWREPHHHNCAVARAEELAALVRRLAEALQPFAANTVKGHAGYTNVDAVRCDVAVTFGDVRRAFDALASTPAPLHTPSPDADREGA